MNLSGEQILLRIHLAMADRTPHVPTYQRLLKAARQQRMAGCTVYQGICGFGPYGQLSSAGWSLIERVPVVVEIVEQADRIATFLQETLSPLTPSALATLERAHVMMYRHRATSGSPQLTLGKPLPSPLCTLPQFQPSTTMTLHQAGVLLRIFIGESDTAGGKPLYEVILEHARQQGLAGATVLRGTEGFGANTVLRKAGLLDLSTDLPIVIEMVDVQEKIEPLLPWLEQVVREGMITMEHVTILLYRGSGSPKSEAPAP